MGIEEEADFLHGLFNKLTIVDGKLRRAIKKNESDEIGTDLQKAHDALEAAVAQVRERKNFVERDV